MRGGNLRRFHPHESKGQKGGEWWKDMGKEALKGAVLQRPRKGLKRGMKRKAASSLSKKEFKKVKRKGIRDIFGK